LTLPVNSTILTGSGYDPDGTITSYAWSRVSGPAAFTLVNPNAAATGLNGLVQGTYVFRLTVTDNSGATATDVVTVTVNLSNNQGPTANAGADITITLPVNTTTLYGSGNDPDGTIATYTWASVSGPASFTLANTSSATTGLYNLVQGVYVFRLTVTDNRGATATDNVTVTVNAAVPTGNIPPTARTENDITITLPLNNTQVHGNTSSDPDGVIVTYSWTQVSGPAAATITNGTAPVATVSNLTTGIYTFELKVTDDDGATSTRTMKVTVNNQVSSKPFIKVYPNPTSGTLNLQYVENANGKFRLVIYDANRRLMKDEIIDKNQVSITKTMDVSLFESGVYFIQLVSPDNGTVVVQFVKM
jgi:ribosomal protein L14